MLSTTNTDSPKAQRATNLDWALKYASIGIRVFPLRPATKIPATPNGVKDATRDEAQIRALWAENPACGVALAPEFRVGGACFLEFDQRPWLPAWAKECNERKPVTRLHRSGGKGGPHYIFLHTEKSLELGNCNGAYAGREWFSFRADNRYIVAPPSIHPDTKNEYTCHLDIEPTPIPDWLVAKIAREGVSESKFGEGLRQCSEDFDFDRFCGWLERAGCELGTEDGAWIPFLECPVVGRRHEGQGTRGCALYWDGGAIGFKCQAQGCPSNMDRRAEQSGIGYLVSFLSQQNGPYDGTIWDEQPIEEVLAAFGANYLKAPDLGVCSNPECKAGLWREEASKPCAGCDVAKVIDAEPEPRRETAQQTETQAESEVPFDEGLQYPELAFPRDKILYAGSNLEYLVGYACKGYGDKPWVLDPGLMTEVILTLASGLPEPDEMLGTRLSRFSVLLAVSRGGKGMSWQRGTRTLGLREGTDFNHYSPSGHVQMIYELGDRFEGKKPNQTRYPGPRRMVWITDELSGCLKMAAGDGSKVLQQLLDFYDRNYFPHRDSRTGKECTMDCRVSWGTCLAVGYGKIEDRKFSGTFTDVSNDGLIGRMFFGFSEQEVDPRDLDDWVPPVAAKTTTVEGHGDEAFTFESYPGSMGSKIADHKVRGYDPGVEEAYRSYKPDPGTEFPGWPFALKKNMVHIALVNLHENVTAEDFDAAVAHMQWQGVLRKVFLASQADDQPQARFNEMVIRALRKEDQRMAKKGKPVEARTVYVPRLAQRYEWSLRGKSLGLDKTVAELENMGVLVADRETDDGGKEVRDWKHVRLVHKRAGCWCGEEHKA